MEANDAADQILELTEGGQTNKPEDDRFRSRAAISIAIMAMLLAIASLGGGNAAEDMMSSNIQASDTWAFYQAKNIRQTAYRLSADALETELQIHQDSMPPETRESVQRRISEYRRTAERYEDEPDPKEPANPLRGEGKKQLVARARGAEEQRDQAIRQDPNFDYSESLFQIAIVLASVAILSMSRLIMKISMMVGIVAFALMLNGFFLLFHLPF